VSGFGACILSCDGPRLTGEERAFFRDADPFGFILFARHAEDANQIRALCAELRDAVGRDCLITIDQEGGRVQRLRPPLARDWLPPLDHGAAAEDAVRAHWLRARIIAHELRALGIDSNCVPTLDIAGPETHPFLHNRCLGTDPDTVIARGRAVADGTLAGGVVPVMKHLPGHGRAQQDSHHDLPRVDADAATLRATDFRPFAALADLPMAMTAHLVYPAIDDRPATLSPAVIALIREEMGVTGLLMSDDISMQALSGPLERRCRDALAAGCDLVLHCNDTLAERRAVAEACGTMTPAAQSRADAAVGARRPRRD
jgi:beta-N-acetylhexosaminidase